MLRTVARISCLLVLPVVLLGCGGDSSTNSSTVDATVAHQEAGKMAEMYGTPKAQKERKASDMMKSMFK